MPRRRTHIANLSVTIASIVLAGCGMFVDLDDINYVGPDGTPSTTDMPVAGEDMAADMDLDSVHDADTPDLPADMPPAEEDMREVDMPPDMEEESCAPAPQIDCNAFGQTGCQGFQACIPYLTEDTPPHCLERVRCVSRLQLGGRDLGASCTNQNQCGVGAVCTATKDDSRRRCVAYCRVANPDDCTASTTCVRHFADQVSTEVGLCE